MPVFRHHRHRGKGRDARLADRHHVRARPDGVQESDQVFDVFVQPEAPVGQGHVAGVMPVGDVDVVVGQHGTHRFAQ